MTPVFYTLQIYFGRDPATDNPFVHEFKDVEYDGTKDLNTWLTEVRQKLYTTGFNIATSPTTIQFINPLLIHTAYLIRQDKKFGTT